MTIPTTFAIGATVGGLVTLNSLGVVDPKSSFTPYTVTFRKGDGVLQGQGYSAATWHWDIIPASQRATLRAYITGLSGALVIRMPNNEGVWHQYDCVMDWMEAEEDQYATRTMDLLLKFSHLVIDEP